MATFFSDHYTADGDNLLALVAGYRPSTGISHGRMRVKTAYFRIETATATNADIIRIAPFKSGDRVHRIIYSNDGAATAGDMDIGLYAAGRNHDGAVIDDNLFADALDITSAILQVDEFKQSTTLDDYDRGKPLWALAAIGGGSDTVDPVLDYDLTASVPTKPDADTETRVEVWYTAGD